MKQLNSILLIDDDMVTNFLNKNLINNLAIAQEVLTFKNGQEALSFFQNGDSEKKESIDLIFLDLNMPIMDGYQFMDNYHQLEANKKTAKIVALIAENTEKPAEEIARQLGVNDYFSKPITKEKLSLILQKHFSI
tara:strand:+ start:5065 stop:5469 length:405 start_codon:yes stop_codon:yes gene_type:complete